MKNTSKIQKFVTKIALVVVFFGSNLNAEEAVVPFLGYSFDSARQKIIQTECVQSTIDEGGEEVGRLTYQEEANSEQISSCLDASYSANADALIMTSSQNISYAQENASNKNRMNWFLSFETKAKTKTLRAGNLALTPFAMSLLELGPEEIEKKCGDGYISHIRYGARLTVTLKIDFASSSDKKAFKSSVNVDLDVATVKAELKTSLNMVAQRMNSRTYIEIKAQQEGGQNGGLLRILDTSVKNCRIDNMEACLNTLAAIIKYAKEDFSKQLEDPRNFTVLGFETTKYADTMASSINGAGTIVDDYIRLQRSIIRKNYWKQSKYYHRASFIKSRLPDFVPEQQVKRIKEIQAAAQENMALLRKAMSVCLETPHLCNSQIELKDYDLKDLEVIIGDEVDPHSHYGKLLKASKAGNKAEVQKLLSLGGLDLIREYDPKGYLPFHYSLAAGLHEVVQLFVVQDVKRPSKKEGETQLVNLPCTDENAYTPMCLAAMGGKKRHNLCIDILKNDDAQVDAPTAFGLTPLQVAAKCGHEKTLRKLIRLGANKEIKDPHGRWIHHLAAEKGDGNLMRYLVNSLARGVSWQDNHNAIPLHWAARAGNVEAINELLQCGSNIHAQDIDGATPLHWAAKAGRLEAVNRLLVGGADPMMEDNRKKTALHYGLKHLSITERLINSYNMPSMLVKEFVGHSDRVHSYTFSKCGNIIATASYKTVKVWNVNSGTALATFTHPDSVSVLDFSPDGKLLASLNGEKNIIVWDVNNKNSIANFTADKISEIGFGVDGKTLRGTASGKNIYWDIQTKAILHAPIESSPSQSQKASPDGLLISSFKYGKFCLINNRNKLLQNIDTLNHCIFSPDSRSYLTSGSDNVVRLWTICFDNILFHAVKTGNFRVVKMIADRFPLLPYIKHTNGLTPAQMAQKLIAEDDSGRKNNMKAIVEFLAPKQNEEKP